MLHAAFSQAQSLLSRTVSIHTDQQPLGKLLQTMEEEGGFRFSFQSTILPVDSLVSLHTSGISLAAVLDRLLGQHYEYRQAGNFIIIRYAPSELRLLIISSTGNADHYQVTGQIVDKQTNKPIAKASIYEKSLFVAEVSDSSGYFSIVLKRITQPLLLTVTKSNYKSLNMHFLAEINITGNMGKSTEDYLEGNLTEIEKTWLGRILITPDQKIQSANIGNFIARAPVQFSLIPGLNSHGSLSGQVVNTFSFNVIGAYSAGIEGGEIGLVFNMNKDKARYFQLGGAFNLVGGVVEGVQIGGLLNYDLADTRGVQLSLGYNVVRRNFSGFQVGGLANRVGNNTAGIQFSVGINSTRNQFQGLQMGGLLNHTGHTFHGAQLSVGVNTAGSSLHGIQIGTFSHVRGNLRGMQLGIGANRVNNGFYGFQLGGIANINKSTNGFQMAVFANLSTGRLKGLQVGFLNYAKEQNGFQFGIINMSAQPNGYALGLINLAWKGYHKIELAYNPTIGASISYKSGNPKLYNVLKLGRRLSAAGKGYSTGMGWGKAFTLFRPLAFNPEWSIHYTYQYTGIRRNILTQIDLPLALKIQPWLAIRGGPVGNLRLGRSLKDGNLSPSGIWSDWSIGLVIR